MAVSLKLPPPLRVYLCQRGVTLWTPRCRQDLLAVSGGWFHRDGFPPSLPHKIGGAKFRTFAQSISTALAATCTPYYCQGVSGLIFTLWNTAPLTQCIAFNAREESDSIKPIKRNIRLTTICERCQHIVYSLFKPKDIPIGKMSSTKRAPSSLLQSLGTGVPNAS